MSRLDRRVDAVSRTLHAFSCGMQAVVAVTNAGACP